MLSGDAGWGRLKDTTLLTFGPVAGGGASSSHLRPAAEELLKPLMAPAKGCVTSAGTLPQFSSSSTERSPPELELPVPSIAPDLFITDSYVRMGLFFLLVNQV